MKKGTGNYKLTGECKINLRRIFGGGAGFTLVEVMVAAAVGAIVLLAMMSWTDNLLRQQQAMSQKMISLQIYNSLQLLTVNSSECTANLNLQGIKFPTPPGPPFPPVGPTYTFPAGVNLNIYNTTTHALLSTAVPVGSPGNPYPNGYGLYVSSIDLQNIQPVSAGVYSANLVVNFKGTVTPLLPVSSTVFMNTTTAGPDQAVQSCGSQSCASGFTLVSSGIGDQLCISTAAQPAATYAQAWQNCVSAATMGHLCSQEEWEEACYWDSPGAYADGGPKLKLGETPPGGTGGDSVGGGTQEWVSGDFQESGSGGWKLGGRTMGGTAANPGIGIPQHTCYTASFWNGTNSFNMTNSNYQYRCCYHP